MKKSYDTITTYSLSGNGRLFNNVIVFPNKTCRNSCLFYPFNVNTFICRLR